MTTGLHSNLVGTELHRPYMKIFADYTELSADTGPYISDDLYKTALQLDLAKVYFLSSYSPVVWSPLAISAGEANTGANVGTGEGLIYRDKSGAVLNFKKLKQGNNVTITNEEDQVVINADTGGSAVFKTCLINEHFLTSNLDNDEIGQYGWDQYYTGSGSDLSTSPEAGHPGVILMEAGTAASGRSTIYLGSAAFKNIIVGGVNTISFEALIKFTGSIITTDMKRGIVGLMPDSWILDGLDIDYVLISFDPSISQYFQLITSKASTGSIVTSDVTASLNTWYRVGFEIANPTSSPSIQMKINGVSKGTPITTNIPIVALSPGAKVSSNGGINNGMKIDRMEITQLGDEED